MRKHASFLTIIFLLTFFARPVSILAQENATVKERAEKELSKMTPAEIDAKLKEYGMTRAQAEAKAKELGIDLQQYLSRPDGAAASQAAAQTPTLVPTQAVPLPQGIVVESRAQKEAPVNPSQPVIVPGFEGRKNIDGIGLFGYNIFNFPSSTFEPVLNVPTPQNYTLGAGDELVLTIWGETQLYNQLVINREGEVTIPNVGPVVAQGLTVAQLKARLLARLTSVYSGLRGGASGANTWLEVSIGKLRSMQIFVLGEVKKPGGYAVSSMSTGLLGFYVAGGPTVNGSMRDIQILRGNTVVSTIDFYEFALRGDKSKDVRLQDGDVIFVKPAGKRVAITGSVLRPAIYELRTGEELGDLVSIAGGVQFNTYADRAHIERIIPFAERKNFDKNILDLDVKFASIEELRKSHFKLEDGDVVSILKINELIQNRATVIGNVKKPGDFEITPGMTVRDLIRQADGVLDDTFMERASISRVLPDRRKQIIPFDLGKALEGDASNNVSLQSEDEVTVYSKKYFFPEHPISIGGSVRKAGTFVRTEKMMVSDVLVLAGGLTEDALGTEVIVTRMDTVSESVFSHSFTIPTSSHYWSAGQQSDFELKDYDYIFVPSNPNYHKTKLVSVMGEVMYPGTYGILYEGERIASIIKRAGGLKKSAYIEGARLTRLYGGAGLVPVNFVDALGDTTDKANIEVVEGDQIQIDKNPRVIYVRGEVSVPSAVVYEEGAGLKYYLNQAGGVKEDGDENRAVVIQPNGRKWTTSWFMFPNTEILAGATISVPTKVEKESNTLPLMRDWATIMASIAAITIGIIQITK